ncbi:MAG: flagellar biosynthesis protein FlhA [Bdellovibrionaceae bacterium]|nr:flagellar biosynthesis protein FlhA [Pseudobdellovibrionaceae bacterium]
MEQILGFLNRFEKYTKNMDLMVAAALIGVLIVMIVPMPSILLDLALTVSITLSLLILLVALYTDQVLDFSVFPSLLLMSTLFRLSLNVASTRLILSEGHTGQSAAGQVINAFASIVVGNNYAIGLVVFVILTVINFVVITKGSGRIAEVAARFTLDALPGKQMSIDADLNAGLINEEQARARRKKIESEAEFYGAMDGASKFVRGDAIAGIVIMAINILGGLAIGVLQKGLDLATAANYYMQLTIGDGLVSQIPALVISTAAGIVVTKNSTKQSIGNEMANQLFLNSKAVMAASGIVGFIGLVPGLPMAPFMTIAAVLGGIGWIIRENKKQEFVREEERRKEESQRPKAENIESLLPLDMVEVEVGYGLINIVESHESGDLLERIVSIRKQFALDLGVIIPPVHIRDNLQLKPGEYRILIKGQKVASGELRPDCYLAMDPGNVARPIEGMPTKEPAFGLDALWITKSIKEEAELSGYTVVDLPTVMATHITETLRVYAFELFGRQEASQLIENFKKTHPKVVEDLIPEQLPFGTVVRILQGLLKEQISIRDMLTIFEALADEAPRTKDVDQLVENVRRRLARAITAKYVSDDGSMQVMTLGAHVEEEIIQSLIQTEQGVQLAMDGGRMQAIVMQIAEMIESHPEVASQPVLLTSPTVRRHVFRITHKFIPQLIVLSHSEISSQAKVSSVGVVEVPYAG